MTIISSIKIRAIFEMCMIAIRLVLMAVATLAFWALFPAFLYSLFNSFIPELNGMAIRVWIFVALLIAVFNFHLMWDRINYGEWRNVALYGISSFSIVAVSPFFAPLYGHI